MNKEELTEKQKRILWMVINNAQARTFQFLYDYEMKPLKDKSEETIKWYKETLEEFKELRKLKEMLK